MPRTAHYVISTHWDREWYQTFQDFRFQLVRLLDRVIVALQDGTLQGPFQTDGQAIMLQDYLEIRPERTELVKQLVREGKLIVGPWYVLPDEFTVSGEALVRNLRMGAELVRAMGAEPSKAGFLCDMFGHTGQMPQIFAGFGIRGAFIWRGVNLEGKRNVIWEGADGTRLPSFRFGEMGYCDLAAELRRAHQPKKTLDQDGFLADLDCYLAYEAEQSEVDALLLFDGCDHLEWDPVVYRFLRTRMSEPSGNYQVQHSSLDGFLAVLISQQDRITTVVQGELREPGREMLKPKQKPIQLDQQWLIPGVLSSRVRLKQTNARCQALLCQWAEPLSTIASHLLGIDYPQGFLDVAWRWLVQNQPHDSIDGCSIDQVHRDMVYRFDQVSQIAEKQARVATERIAACVAGKVKKKELRLVAFNPLPTQIDGVREIILQIPTSWPTFNEFFGYEPKPAFRIFDAHGNELPYQRLGQEMNRPRMRTHPTKFTQTIHNHLVRVALPLQVPALGYTTLSVHAGYKGEITRHPERPGLATADNALENEYLRIEVQPNGSITLTDKRTGVVYTRLLTFEDCADIGDGWFHGLAVNDQIFSSTACAATVAIVHNGPYLGSLRVRLQFPLPNEFDFSKMERSPEFTLLTIDSLLSLRQGSDWLELQTHVENTVSDHRLRLLLPSAAKANTCLADSAFDVVERPIALRVDNHLYRELEVETRPQQSWTAVFDAERGLAVCAAGLLECAVPDLPERPLALTLFRGTRKTVGTTGEPEGQQSGGLNFHFAILPLQGPPDRRRLCELGALLNAGLRTVQLAHIDQQITLDDLKRSQSSLPALPAQAGFLAIPGPGVLTSLRQVGDALEVRLFNPTNEKSTATLDFSAWPPEMSPPEYMQAVDFESNPIGDVMQVGQIELKPKQIITLKCW